METCQACGAVGHGNFWCLTCLRWLKRWSGGEGTLLRVLIKIRQRLGSPQL